MVGERWHPLSGHNAPDDLLAEASRPLKKIMCVNATAWRFESQVAHLRRLMPHSMGKTSRSQMFSSAFILIKTVIFGETRRETSAFCSFPTTFSSNGPPELGVPSEFLPLASRLGGECEDIVNLRKFTADEFSQLHTVLMDLCKFLAGVQQHEDGASPDRPVASLGKVKTWEPATMLRQRKVGWVSGKWQFGTASHSFQGLWVLNMRCIEIEVFTLDLAPIFTVDTAQQDWKRDWKQVPGFARAAELGFEDDAPLHNCLQDVALGRRNPYSCIGPHTTRTIQQLLPFLFWPLYLSLSLPPVRSPGDPRNLSRSTALDHPVPLLSLSLSLFTSRRPWHVNDVGQAAGAHWN